MFSISFLFRHTRDTQFIQCKKDVRGKPLKEYIEERAMNIANYIVENNATVRMAAKQFGVSKSTVHVEVTI